MAIEADTRQTFSMIDYNHDPPRVIVEITYLSDMFDLENVNQIGQPIEVTLREQSDHFQARQNTHA